MPEMSTVIVLKLWRAGDEVDLHILAMMMLDYRIIIIH